MSIVTPDTSPTDLLDRVRGPVRDARLTYPERVHFEVTDVSGGLWLLATWDADYLPADPAELCGKTVTGVGLDKESGKLAFQFSDGTSFTITPDADEGDPEAILNWELFTPEGLVLTYGPWGRWHLGKATDPY
jgi:hypothetical protein